MSTTQVSESARPSKRQVDAEVGRRIHIMMWDRGLTQTAFGAELGVDQSTLGKKLRGKVGWSLGEIVAVSNLFDVSVSALFGEGPETGPDAPNVRPTDYSVADSNEVVDMFTREPIRAAG